MAAAEQRQAKLARENRALQDELRHLKEKLVQSAERIEKNEAGLADAKARLHVLDDQLQEKSAALKTDRKKLSSMLQAAVSLSRTPPEAMVMMPGDAMETMEAARALAMVSTAIKEESERIAVQIGQLDALKQQVTAQRDELARRQAELDKQREALNLKLKQRAAMQAKISQEQKEETKKLAQLAKKAADLKDLVETLQEDQEKARRERAGDSGMAPAAGGHSFADAMGRIRRPAAGSIVQRFGDGKGRTSKGAVIATPAAAEVVAPFDGKVVYAGKFLDYGRIVIIRHAGGFHTLLAGLAKINVEPGEFLLEGEPIGAMGGSEQNDRLYVELRKDNQPVNPAHWIEGMK